MMTLDEAKTVILYFLFRGEELSLHSNAEALIEASKIVETEAIKILQRSKQHGG